MDVNVDRQPGVYATIASIMSVRLCPCSHNTTTQHTNTSVLDLRAARLVTPHSACQTQTTSLSPTNTCQHSHTNTNTFTYTAHRYECMHSCASCLHTALPLCMDLTSPYCKLCGCLQAFKGYALLLTCSMAAALSKSVRRIRRASTAACSLATLRLTAAPCCWCLLAVFFSSLIWVSTS